MILWLASYPRSGNTFLNVIFRQSFQVPKLSLYEDATCLEEMRRSSQIYAVKTHELPGDDSPALYLARDGRDCLVSYAHFDLQVNQGKGSYSQQEFSSVLTNLIVLNKSFGGWSRHVQEWTQRPAPTAVIHFHDLIARPLPSVQAGLDRLGLALPPTPSGSIPGFSELHERRPDLFRRGQIGSWRDEMPEVQQRLFWQHHALGMEILGAPE